MLNNVLNAIFPRRRPEPRSAGYKAGYASGLTAASLIDKGSMPPEGILPDRDAPGDWSDGYSAGLQEATQRRNRSTSEE